MNKPFISVCVPSFNRPEELLRLLRTVDGNPEETQIVVCEDHAPKRLEVRARVEEFKKGSRYDVKYIENEVNKGYDWNVRDFIIHADGEFIVYCDDDSCFVPGSLDKLITFLKTHRELGYVLRRTRTYTGDDMRYFLGTRFFEPGVETYQILYRKSVIIAGFTFRRELARETLTDRFDGTLLYQLYILAEICLKHPSAYFDVPITEKVPSSTEFYFGMSEKEKGLYEPKKVTVRNSMNFVVSFLKITRYIDEKYNLKSTDYVRQDISKYSYPILAFLMRNGRREMLKGAREMLGQGLGGSMYFYLYLLGLFFLGVRNCDRMIVGMKKVLGHTPSL